MNKIHFQNIVLALCLIPACLVATPVLAASQPSEQALDEIVVVINDSVITQSEVDEAIANAKKQLQTNNIALPTPKALRKQVLEQLINRKLQLQLAEQANVQMPDAAVDKAIANIAAQNKLSTTELYAQVKNQGLTTANYRKEIREEMLLQQIQQQEIGSHITITPSEVDDFIRSAAWQAYNNKEYHLEDILIALPDAPSTTDMENAKKTAQTVLAKIHQGADFKEVASSNSGSNGALQGGDLGWRKLPQIPSAFSSEIVHMKQGQIMGPILTPNGFHIVKLSGIRSDAKAGSADSDRKQVEQLLYQRKFEEALQSWITKLRGQAFVHMNTEKS